MGNLASTYRNQGRWNEALAEQLEVQVMDLRKKLLGAEHPNTLTVLKYRQVYYVYTGIREGGMRQEVEVMNIEIIIGRN
jgi:hypothetical protein